MAKTNPAQFVGEVKQEFNKVTWPTKNETLQATLMVLIMCVIFAIFFFFVDLIASKAIQGLLTL